MNDERLIRVLEAAEIFLAVKRAPRNVFVRQLGSGGLTEEKALQLLEESVNHALPILDEVMKKRMDEIESEETEFEDLSSQSETS
jgi:hypothetical protein